MKISIIVPVYNVCKYLLECFDSIRSQDYRDYELLIADDGSFDSSAAMCDEEAVINGCAIILHMSNHGQATARNMAVAESIGEYICFIDSDDIIHPRMLEILHQNIEKDAALISMCSPVCGTIVPLNFDCEQDGVSQLRVADETFFLDLIGADFYTQGIKLDVIWGKLIKREILTELPFKEGKIFEDTAVICKWFDRAQRVSDTSSKLYFYRLRENSTITSEFSYKKLDELWADEEIETFYRIKKYSTMAAFATKRFCDHAIGFEKKLQDNGDIVIKNSIRRRKNRKIIRNIFTWTLTMNDFYYYCCEVFTFLPKIYACYRKIIKH